jgi:hypothetical protein
VILRWTAVLVAVDSWMVCRISCKPAGCGVQGCILKVRAYRNKEKETRLVVEEEYSGKEQSKVN